MLQELKFKIIGWLLLVVFLSVIAYLNIASWLEVAIFCGYLVIVFVIDQLTTSLWFIGIGRLLVGLSACILLYKLQSGASLVVALVIMDIIYGLTDRAKVLLNK